MRLHGGRGTITDSRVLEGGEMTDELEKVGSKPKLDNHHILRWGGRRAWFAVFRTDVLAQDTTRKIRHMPVAVVVEDQPVASARR